MKCICKTPEPRIKNSENGVSSYCDKCAKNYDNKTEQEKDIEKIKAFVKGKFNHPDAEQIIINFIAIMNNGTEK